MRHYELRVSAKNLRLKNYHSPKKSDKLFFAYELTCQLPCYKCPNCRTLRFISKRLKSAFSADNWRKFKLAPLSCFALPHSRLALLKISV